MNYHSFNYRINLNSKFNSGCSAARLARVVRDDEVGGSNPLTPTNDSSLLFRRV